MTNSSSLIHEIVDTFEGKPHYGLTELGATEMRSIAKRFRARYPNLFANFDSERMSIISSSKARSIESGTNFTLAAFDDDKAPEHHHNEILEHFVIDDEMLRGFDHCQRYIHEIKDNEQANKEISNFKKSEKVQKLVREFKKRHFIDDAFDLSIGKGIFKCKF